MGSGRKRRHRIPAVIAVAAVGLVVTGPANAQTTIPVDTWSGRGTAHAVELSVHLPPAIQGAFQTLGVDSPLPATITETVASSLAEAQWRWDEDGNVVGRGVGELFGAGGTIGALVADLVPVPRAEAALGTEERDALAAVSNAGISVGAGEVFARAFQHGSREIESRGASRVAGIEIRLADLLSVLPGDARAEVDAAIDQLLGALYGGNENLPDELQAGLVPTLQGVLDQAKAELAEAGLDLSEITGLDLRIPTLGRGDLIDRPLVSIGLIESRSDVEDGTGDLAGYKVTRATTTVSDVSLLGGLVHIDVLRAEAGAAVNGLPGEAVIFDPVQTIAGLRIGDQRVEVGDVTSLSGITVNGQPLDLGSVLPEDLVTAIHGLYGTIVRDVIGLAVSVPRVEQGVEEGANVQKAHQRVTALLVSVNPLGTPVLGESLGEAAALLPTISAKFSTASVDVGSKPLTVLDRCVGDCNPATGLPTHWILAGLLLAAAGTLRRFVLA